MSATIQTFEFETDDEQTDGDTLEFTVTDSFENRYGDVKAVVETPAPWDTPDEMTPANEVVKSLEWEQHHYTFDKDREAWTLDIGGLKPLAELAEDAGYEWNGAAKQESDEGAQESHLATFVELTDAVACSGDDARIKVRYAKKNGNGENTYKGDSVSATRYASVKMTSRLDAEQRNLTFKDEDGKRKTVSVGDKGDIGLFSGGYHPFMGNVLEVTLIR